MRTQHHARTLARTHTHPARARARLQGAYALFTHYPKFIVDFQEAERQRIVQARASLYSISQRRSATCCNIVQRVASRYNTARSVVRHGTGTIEHYPGTAM